MLFFFLMIACAVLSLIFLLIHFFGRYHSNVALALGSIFLVIALVLVPLCINALAKGDSETISITDALDFYGTVAGLLSSFFLGYIAFRISRNDHKRNNSSCVTITNLQCKPIFLKDSQNTKEELPSKGSKGFIGNITHTLKLLKKESGTFSEAPAQEMEIPMSVVRRYNHQSFPDIPDVGKLTNGRDIRLTSFQEKRRAVLKKRIEKLSSKKKQGRITKARLLLAQRQHAHFINYASESDAKANKVLALQFHNQGPSVLQQIILYFSESNCVFTSYIALTEGETKRKFFALPDESIPGEVVYVTFISCYNERTYGEFKLTPVQNHAPQPSELKDADEAVRSHQMRSQHFTIKHYHYYGVNDHQ